MLFQYRVVYQDHIKISLWKWLATNNNLLSFVENIIKTITKCSLSLFKIYRFIEKYRSYMYSLRSNILSLWLLFQNLLYVCMFHFMDNNVSTTITIPSVSAVNITFTHTHSLSESALQNTNRIFIFYILIYIIYIIVPAKNNGRLCIYTHFMRAQLSSAQPLVLFYLLSNLFSIKHFTRILH